MVARRKLGTSGLSTIPLVLGTNTFGWTADRDTTFEILDAFYAGGGRMLDTADVYGASETLIGEWLGSRKHRDVLIATKLGYTHDGSPGLTAARIEKEAEESLRKLRSDNIALYFAHFPDPATPIGETLQAFDKLVRAGKVQAIGASNYDAVQMAEALRASRGAELTEYSVIQPNYSLAARDGYEGALRDLCLEDDIGVIAYFALASGFLTGKYRKVEDIAGTQREPHLAPFLTPRNFRALEMVDQVAAEAGSTNSKVALAWLMAQPGITAPIASASRVGQVDELFGAMDLVLSADQLRRLDEASAATTAHAAV